MKSFSFRTIVGLIVLIGGGLGLAVTFAGGQLGLLGKPTENKPPVKAAVAIPVSVVQATTEPLEVTATYAGMIRPYEKYTLSFEMGGEIAGFNANDGTPQLDEGAFVTREQIIARQDPTLMRVAYDEAAAQLEEAQTRLSRLQRIIEINPQAVSKEELQDRVTQDRLANARLDRAQRNLENTLLRAPATCVISKRYLNPKVVVAPHTPVMELLDVSRLLLVVGIPEAKIQTIQKGQSVKVRLIGRDIYGKLLPPREGKVFRIAQSAAQDTGLFEVEIIIPNSDQTLITLNSTISRSFGVGYVPTAMFAAVGTTHMLVDNNIDIRLRPGLIARGEITIQEMQGYRFPVEVLVTRNQQEGIYVITNEQKAKFVPIKRKIEQGQFVLIPTLPSDSKKVVLQGQHRLIDGSSIEIVHEYQGTSTELLNQMHQSTISVTQ